MRKIRISMYQHFVILLLVISLSIVITIPSGALASLHQVKALATNWSEDIPLSNLTDDRSAYSPDIAMNNTSIHVIYEPGYYTRSLDGSRTWAERYILTYGTSGLFPKIAVNKDLLHVVYEKVPGTEVYYKRSLDNGDIWGSDVLLSEDDGKMSGNPQIAVSGSNIHVVWQDEKDYGWWDQCEIYYKRSTNNGSDWDDGLGHANAVRRLTNNSANSAEPVIIANASTLHVFWADNRDGNYEVRYRRSEDNGENWTPDRNITIADGVNSHPEDAIVIGGTIYLVGRDIVWGSPDQFAIWITKSVDGGDNWSTPLRIVDHFSTGYCCGMPSIEGNNTILFLGWTDTRTGIANVYYKYSTDYGNYWSEDTQVTYSTGGCGNPKLALGDHYLHLVWHDIRYNNTPEVFYKRSPGFSPEITYACPETENVTINETESITFNITAYDPDNQTLNYFWYVNNQLTDTNTTIYTFYTNYDSAGLYNIIVAVSDPNLTAYHSWNLTVLNVNRRPEIIDYLPKENVTITEFQNQTFWVNASDDDGDATIYGWYLNDSLVLENKTTYIFTPDENSSGNYPVKVIVSDGNLSVNRTWTITVINIKHLQTEIYDLQAQLQQLSEDYAKLSDTLIRLTENLTTLWEELNNSELNSTELRNKVQELMNNLTALKEQLNLSDQTNTVFQNLIDNLTQTLNVPSEQIVMLWEQLNQSLANETEFRNLITQLNQSINSLQGEIEKLREENEQIVREREVAEERLMITVVVLVGVILVCVLIGVARKKK